MPGIVSEENEDGEKDELYDEAVAFVAQSRRASISAVQRRLRIGYNRAARMIETMEEAGVLSPMASNGNREVLIPPPPEDLIETDSFFLFSFFTHFIFKRKHCTCGIYGRSSP